MRFAVIGLGSMGKRRIRNLLANEESDIVGIDVRNDRRVIAENEYKIKTYQRLEDIPYNKEIDAFIISVPPDRHMEFAHFAVDNNIHCFIEASVVEEGINELLEKCSHKADVKICPSCTLRFHPSVKLLKELVESKRIGKISNFSYHSGQYLPDWHPWEKIFDFYVSKRETGGCREIVPFELTWINWVFGDLASVCGFKNKTIDLEVDIDDVYAVALKYRNGVLGTLIVDVVSRHAVRKIVINGDEGQIQWDWDKKCVDVYFAKEKRWVNYHEPQGSAHSGYNSNIIEEMYIEEIKDFIDTIKGKKDFMNTLSEDHKILKYLYDIEKSSETGVSITYKK